MVSAEQSLLACILKKGDLIQEVSLQPIHFSKLEHQIIFTAMKEIDSKNDPIDIVSIKMHMGQDLLMYGGTNFLADLKNSIATIENFKTYEKYILNDFKIRKTKELAKQIETFNSPKDIDDLQAVIEEVNQLLEQHSNDKEFDLADVLLEIQEDVDTPKEGVSGIPTGFTELDNVLDGLSEEELTILGARPSVGKTAISLGIANNVCKTNHFVDFFSLEMSDKSLVTRMICSIAGINSMKMKNALKRFNSDDWTAYSAAQVVLNGYKENFAIYDNSKVTVPEIRAKVKQSIKKYPDKRHLVIIDYLTLVQGSGRRERHLEVGEITRNLKRMARELKVSVLLLSQLSRSVEQRQDKRPMLSDLRDSGEIEQDADKILFLHRDDYYDKESENENIIDVIIAKNRNGSLGVVSLVFEKETQRFFNMERRYGESNG